MIAFSSEIVGSHSMFPIGGSVNQFNHNRKWYGGSSNFFFKLNYQTIQQSHFWVYSQRKRGHYVEEIPTYMLVVALFTIAEIRK